MRCRKNVRNLSETEKRRFIEAILALKAKDSVLHPGAQKRYDDFVELHREAMLASVDWAHGDSSFMPWHRELLWQFENELRGEVPGVTIPYWDWTREQSSTDDGFPFTDDFLHGNGDSSDGDRVPRASGHETDSPYPFPFDPEDWTVTVKDDGSDPSYLRRTFGTRSDAPGLPENDTVVTGASTTFRDAISGSVDYETHRARSENLHNLVHRWVNGNMLDMTSPNDPVFFLHHAAIDRMWSIWQANRTSGPLYENTSGADGHVADEPMNFNESGDPVPWTGADSVEPNDMIDGHALYGEGVWYETDIPEITLDSGSTLDFPAVPEGLTMYRAVNFRVQTCRNVHFRITSAPTNPTEPFGLTVLGTEFIVEPSDNEDDEFVTGLVWFRFTAFDSTTPPPTSVEIETYIVDEEGYHTASEGDILVLGTYNIDLTASVTPQLDSSVVMVLDRSGSMAADAGGGNTRSDLLKSAVKAFHALLRPADELGIVSFDELTETVQGLTIAAAGLADLDGGALEPRGSTGIGSGILAGSSMLSGAAHANRTLLVLTDGNENQEPFVADLPAGTIDSTTYAIGFGRSGEVSEGPLNTITQNSGGDLIVTGDITTTEQQFLLTKYFLQVLTGVQSHEIVLDPQGSLTWQSDHRIPFDITEADVDLDVVALCPVPELLDFRLITPGGREIAPATTGPNGSFHTSDGITYYRFKLPAIPLEAATSHHGTWHARLRLKRPEDLKREVDTRRLSTAALSALGKSNALPYSCSVYTRSSLRFDVGMSTAALEPGDDLLVVAQVSQYGIPLARPAQIWAELDTGVGSTQRIRLEPTEEGTQEAVISIPTTGVRTLRVRAAGKSLSGSKFTREKTLTASSFLQDQGYGRPCGGSSGDLDESLCRWLRCLLDGKTLDPKLLEKMRRKGLDLESLARCLCSKDRPDPCESQCEEKKAEYASSTKKSASIARKRESTVVEEADRVARGRESIEKARECEKKPAECEKRYPLPRRRRPDTKPETVSEAAARREPYGASSGGGPGASSEGERRDI